MNQRSHVVLPPDDGMRMTSVRVGVGISTRQLAAKMGIVRQDGGRTKGAVLSDGNINYSGTTIKRKRRWMPIECRKLETRRVRKETKGGQMEKKPRG